MIYRRIRASTGPTLWVAAVLVVITLTAPAAAMATSPTTDQYGSRSQQIAATGSGGSSGGGASATTTGHRTSGSLPFTGLDLGVLALAAVALLGAGIALRRYSHAKG
jgi:hypothetical protein